MTSRPRLAASSAFAETRLTSGAAWLRRSSTLFDSASNASSAVRWVERIALSAAPAVWSATLVAVWPNGFVVELGMFMWGPLESADSDGERPNASVASHRPIRFDAMGLVWDRRIVAGIGRVAAGLSGEPARGRRTKPTAPRLESAS